MCRVLGVSRSWYYARLKAGACKRYREDRKLSIAIQAAFDKSSQTYGTYRIVEELRDAGIRVEKNASGGCMACGLRLQNASGLRRIRSLNAKLRRTWFNVASQPKPRIVSERGHGLPRDGAISLLS